ncbi:MAG: hypothetical protein FD135_1371 [Comamonadaceae bacterium]|nr:MAG: hypothetical protein FD135_1371 [Comamonadaceae bacterium]
MRGLQTLLLRKIYITCLFWCLPLLVFPRSWFVALGMPAPEPLVFVRLLGAAYLALLVGYYLGMRGLETGESPAPVIDMGITSNGLAGLLLLYFGATGAWSAWGGAAQVFMWVSMLGALAITWRLLGFRRRWISQSTSRENDLNLN